MKEPQDIDRNGASNQITFNKQHITHLGTIELIIRQDKDLSRPMQQLMFIRNDQYSLYNIEHHFKLLWFESTCSKG